MPVFRVMKNANYTVMSNVHLRDRRLSLKAKGLLSQMLSLPDGWDYTLRGLASINRDGIDAIRAAVVELEEAGYVERDRNRDALGRLSGSTYTVYERPTGPGGAGCEACAVAPRPPKAPAAECPALEEPALDFPTLDEPAQGKSTQSNTDKPNTEESNTDRSSTDGEDDSIFEGKPGKEDADGGAGEGAGQRHRHGRYRNVLLTDADLARLKADFPQDWEERVERLSEYMRSTGRVYKDHLATMRAWARRDGDAFSRKPGGARRVAQGHDYRVKEGDAL